MIDRLDTHFEPANPEEMPKVVADEMLSRSRMLNYGPKITLENLENISRLEHPNGDYSWLGQHDKVYHNGDIESNSYVVDVNPDNTLTGTGEIRFAKSRQDAYFKDKPFVGWTKTEQEFERQGLGRRRLLAMNMASLALHGNSLHSDTLFSHMAVPKMWERLVDEGLAARYEEPNSTGEKLTRYRFL